ncbi:MAG: hypothetical protein ACIAXF_16365, partial [Phycisphaerales bacterium JB063]
DGISLRADSEEEIWRRHVQVVSAIRDSMGLVFFEEINPGASSIQVHQSSEMPSPWGDQLVYSMLASESGGRLMTIRPSILYAAPLQEGTDLPQSSVIYVDVSIVSGDSNGVRHTRKKRFVWNEGANAWQPVEYYLLNGQTMMLEFF